MNCPNCNKPLQPHQRFCPACGTGVEELTGGTQPAENQWQPQEVQPEPPQAEWRPQEVQPEPPQAEWQPENVQPEPPQYKQPQQPAYQPPQGGQNDRYAAQFQQYQQPSRFANPKHAQGGAVYPTGKKQKDKK